MNLKTKEVEKHENEILKATQTEAKESARNLADDGKKMYEFQFYDELVPESFDAEKKTVKINYTVRDTIQFQHHHFVAEADVKLPTTPRGKVRLETKKFGELK